MSGASSWGIPYSYDAAGNFASDDVYNYTYDAEGNLIEEATVGGTAVGIYLYDAANRRVSAQTGSTTNEYLYDYAGRRTSTWLNPSPGNVGTGTEGRIYWDGGQLAYRAWDGTTYFEQQDYLGTERIRTNYQGTTVATFTSLPWGDGSTQTVGGTGPEQDNNSFAGLELDINTMHAQFRNYSATLGRWWSPDPYDGSYDITNPQSFNRYAYALNNPLSFKDPSGLDCSGDGVSDPYYDGDCDDEGNGAGIGGGDCVYDQYGNCYTSNGNGGIDGGPPQSVTANTGCASDPDCSLFGATYSGLDFGVGLSGPSMRFQCGFANCQLLPNAPSNPFKTCGRILAKGAVQTGLDALGVIPGEGLVAGAIGKEVLAGYQILAGSGSTVISVASGDQKGIGLGATGITIGIASLATDGIKGAAEAIPVVGQYVALGSALWDVGSTAFDFGECKGWW